MDQAGVPTANRGEVWVSDCPAASAGGSSQSDEHLVEDAVYKTHVEKDFIAFCSTTPRTCLSVRTRVWGLEGASG